MTKLKKMLLGLALVLALLVPAATAMAEDSSSEDGGQCTAEEGQYSDSEDSSSEDCCSEDGSSEGGRSEDGSSEDGGQCVNNGDNGACYAYEYSCDEWIPPYDGPSIWPDDGTGIPLPDDWGDMGWCEKYGYPYCESDRHPPEREANTEDPFGPRDPVEPPSIRYTPEPPPAFP